MKIYPALLALLLSPLLSIAQTDQPPARAFPRLAIKLLVGEGNQDSAVNDIARGYILDELGTINDVDIVQDDEVLCIHCLIMPTKNGLGIANGYVLCWVTTSQIPNIVGKRLVNSATGIVGINEDTATKIKHCFKNDGIYAGGFLQTCPRNNLKQAIADTIAAMNGRDFEILRQIKTNNGQ